MKVGVSICVFGGPKVESIHIRHCLLISTYASKHTEGRGFRLNTLKPHMWLAEVAFAITSRRSQALLRLKVSQPVCCSCQVAESDCKGYLKPLYLLQIILQDLRRGCMSRVFSKCQLQGLNYRLQATEDKNAAVAQAEKTASKARLAERLITGLAGEFERWTKTIQEFAIAEGKQILYLFTAAMHYQKECLLCRCK